jgi:hypothetical protein
LTRTRQGLQSQPLSGKDYIVAALIMVGIGLLLLVLFVAFIPRLVPADALDRFFYILVIVWGLVCAIVLFGVMRSYAHVTYKRLGMVVELGGPAAFAALVVVGGFWLVPRTDTFDLTIRPHGTDFPLINTGRIRIEFDRLSLNEDINSNGEADFKAIPRRFWGATVQVLPLVDGFAAKYQSLVINRNALDLQLLKAAPPETLLRGQLRPVPLRRQVVRILVQGEEGTPDLAGKFQFIIHKKLGETVRINVCADGRSIYDDYQTLTEGEIEIPTHRPDVRCGS